MKFLLHRPAVSGRRFAVRKRRTRSTGSPPRIKLKLSFLDPDLFFVDANEESEGDHEDSIQKIRLVQESERANQSPAQQVEVSPKPNPNEEPGLEDLYLDWSELKGGEQLSDGSLDINPSVRLTDTSEVRCSELTLDLLLNVLGEPYFADHLDSDWMMYGSTYEIAIDRPFVLPNIDRSTVRKTKQVKEPTNLQIDTSFDLDGSLPRAFP